MFGDLLTAIGRRKQIDTDTVEDTKLNRVLTVFDLTALGVGATLGKIYLDDQPLLLNRNDKLF